MRYSKDKINDILITWYSGKPQNNRSPAREGLLYAGPLLS